MKKTITIKEEKRAIKVLETSIKQGRVALKNYSEHKSFVKFRSLFCIQKSHFF